MTVDSVKKEVDITLIEMDELMGALMYRGGLEKLPYCPRCEATCGCGGHRVAQSSQAVPRSYWGDDYIDMGFWCWCCFSQTWNLVSEETKMWLEELHKNPGQWTKTATLLQELDAVTSDWEQECLQLQFGCEWQSLNDETNMKLKKDRAVGDLPFGVRHSGTREIAMSSGVSRLIERALAKDERARRRK